MQRGSQLFVCLSNLFWCSGPLKCLKFCVYTTFQASYQLPSCGQPFLSMPTVVYICPVKARLSIAGVQALLVEAYLLPCVSVWSLRKSKVIKRNLVYTVGQTRIHVAMWKFQISNSLILMPVRWGLAPLVPLLRRWPMWLPLYQAVWEKQMQW